MTRNKFESKGDIKAWLNDEKRVAKHNDHDFDDFAWWFENGSTDKWIMEETGVKSANTMRDYRTRYNAQYGTSKK